MIKVPRFTLFLILCILFLLQSCAILDNYCAKRNLDKPGQLIDSTKTSKVKTDTVYRNKNILVPVYIKDTSTQKLYENLLNKVDSLESKLSDEQAAKYLKDNKIRNLLWQIANKKFSTDTMKAENKFSSAFAFVLNNELHLELFSKDIDTAINVGVSLPEIHTTQADETTLIFQKTVKQSVLVNPWFYLSIGLLLLFLIMVVLVIRLRIPKT